ncbi:MAG: S9 family peptidase [Pseudomonadota bacterium]
MWKFITAGVMILPALLAPVNARDFTLDDVLSIKEVSAPRISPDGRNIAFVETRNDLDKDEKRSSIFVVTSDGSQTRRMTAENYSAFDPQWSPDGKYLSFIAARVDQDANAAPQVYTLDLKGGDALRYSNAPQGVESHLWSPSGDRMLLVIRDESAAAKEARLAREGGEDEKARPWIMDRRQFKQDGVGYLDRSRAHIYVLAERGGAPAQISSGDFEDAEPQWRPDGAEIAFVSNRTPEPDGNYNTDIWVVSSDPKVKGAKLRKLTTNEGPDRAPSWSPDGKHIAYVSSVAPKLLWYATNHLAIIDAAGGDARLVTQSLDRNIDRPRFTASGDSVIATVEDNAEQKVAVISLSTGQAQPLIAGADTVFEFDLHPSGAIAAPVSRPDLPSEIFLYTDSKLTQATWINDAALKGVKFSTPLNVTFKSFDGATVQGFIYPPVNGRKKAPGFLFIHGGPTGQYDHSFDRTAQFFAANGYAVIMPNPRGSTGWGQDFAAALFADWGGVDFGDVMAATDDAAARGIVDEKRLVVGGWSYGGILTDHVITKTNRFKAAISGASEVIYIGNYGHDIYQLEWETELGLPWENRDGWEKITPFYDVAKVTTPTLVIGGKDDWNVPVVNSEQLYQALKRLGVPTELVVYPGEDHSIDRPSFIKDRLERYLDWYGRYVKR